MSQKEQQEVIEAEIVPHTEAQASSEIATASIYGTMTVGQLKKATQKMAEQRAVITQYVSDQLIDGTDYGRIHINKNCPNKYNPKDCKVDGHFSKKVLFKPGQEKIFSLFNLSAKCYRDTETLAMLGNPEGLVALICKVYRGGSEIAEGRGAAKIGDNSRDANATIKIAEKRARMDACLSLGFSEFFTQDIEDPEYRKLAEGTADVGSSSADAPRPATPKQKGFIASLMQDIGIEHGQMVEALKLNGIGIPTEMTSSEASHVIGLLKEGGFKTPGARPDNVDKDGVIADPELDAARGDGAAMASLAEDRGRAEESMGLNEVVLTNEDDFTAEGIQAALEEAIPDNEPF